VNSSITSYFLCNTSPYSTGLSG